MENIYLMEKKTNKEVLGIVKEKRTFMNAIRTRRWKMVGHALGDPEELLNIIL